MKFAQLNLHIQTYCHKIHLKLIYAIKVLYKLYATLMLIIEGDELIQFNRMLINAVNEFGFIITGKSIHSE